MENAQQLAEQAERVNALRQRLQEYTVILSNQEALSAHAEAVVKENEQKIQVFLDELQGVVLDEVEEKLSALMVEIARLETDENVAKALIYDQIEELVMSMRIDAANLEDEEADD